MHFGYRAVSRSGRENAQWQRLTTCGTVRLIALLAVSIRTPREATPSGDTGAPEFRILAREAGFGSRFCARGDPSLCALIAQQETF